MLIKTSRWIGAHFIYSIARLMLPRRIFFWGITKMGKILPHQVISETGTLVCFYHPRPEYPIHILLVPKEEIRDLMYLNPEDDEFLRDLFTAVRSLVEELNLQERGYRLVVNGGEYQDFPQLHFHLLSGE